MFVGRQPIFNRKEQVVSYELLYRDSETNTYSAEDGDQATTDLIINSFLNIGIETLTEGKRCYINFTESLLSSDLLTYFDPHQLVIEILENVPITQALIMRCKQLKNGDIRLHSMISFLMEHILVISCLTNSSIALIF